MPPFRYDQYRSPYTGTISDLMQAPAQAQARAAEQIGQAQANAALQRGAAWSGAAQNIGQAIGAIPQQIQQAKAFEQRQKFQTAQMAEMAAQTKQREAAVAAAEREAQGVETLRGAIKASMNPETGEIDHQSVAKLTTQGGFPFVAQSYMDGIEKTQTSALRYKEAVRKAAEDKTEHLGELALNARNALKRFNDPLQARDAVLGHVAAAAATGAVSEQEAQDFLMRTATVGPDQLGQVFQGFIDKAPGVSSKEGARLKQEADTRRVEAETKKTEAEIAGKLPPTPAQAETARHNAAMEKIGLLTAGRAEASAAETRRHNLAMEENARLAKTNKPSTGEEKKTLAFYNRAKEALDTLTTADKSGRSMEQRVAGSGLIAQGQLQYAPNIAQTEEQQQYRQAQRAFTEARLRKESGAAIPKEEYENDAKTYFARPGDAPALIEQKRKARETVLEGLRFGAGRAYEEFYGGGAGSDVIDITRGADGKLLFPKK